jgi:hypothetical protein
LSLLLRNKNTSNDSNDCKAKDTVDVKINDELADVVNGFFREGISDENYSEIMKSIARPENCTSLTKTRVSKSISVGLAFTTN